MDDSATGDDTGIPAKPLPTAWVECNWAAVPSSPLGSVWVGQSTTWFSSDRTIYTIDAPTHTLLKDDNSPSGTRAMWADADDNLYTLSNKSVSMRPVGGAWTTLLEEKRSLQGMWGNDLGLWVGTSDGSVLLRDPTGKWSEEQVASGSFIRSIWGRNSELWVATAIRVYHRSPAGDWTLDTEVPDTKNQAFEDLRGDEAKVFATIDDSGIVLRRDSSGAWSEGGPDGAVGDVHLWEQQSAWFATDGTATWKLAGLEWSEVSGPEREVAALAVGSNGTTAYALGGGDAVASSEPGSAWDLVLGSPWRSVYDAEVVGGNMFAAGEAGLYPNETGLVRYISDGYWVEELHAATVRALHSPDDAQMYAAGDGGVWHMDPSLHWTAEVTSASQTFTGLTSSEDGEILSVTADGMFYRRATDGTWTSEVTGASSLASVYVEGEDVWAVGAGIFRRDPVSGWTDESPSDGAGAWFNDVEAVHGAHGERPGIWAVGEADGMPAIYSRGADGVWAPEIAAPDFSDSLSGLFSGIDTDAQQSIWLVGERVTKKSGETSFVMHSDPAGWVGEEPGGDGIARKMIWISDRRWLFGDHIDIRPRNVKGCI
jgi:hypothetical protein